MAQQKCRTQPRKMSISNNLIVIAEADYRHTNVEIMCLGSVRLYERQKRSCHTRRTTYAARIPKIEQKDLQTTSSSILFNRFLPSSSSAPNPRQRYPRKNEPHSRSNARIAFLFCWFSSASHRLLPLTR